MLEKFRLRSAVSRKIEEQLYEQVAREIASQWIVQGLWLKALTDANGNETLAKARYVKLRVQSLIDEYRITGVLRESAESQEGALDSGVSKNPPPAMMKALSKSGYLPEFQSLPLSKKHEFARWVNSGQSKEEKSQRIKSVIKELKKM